MTEAFTSNRLFLWMLGGLFLVSSFYYVPNTGGTGLHLPMNIVAWLTACWGIGIAFLLSVVRRVFYYPRHWFLILAFPGLVILGGLLADVNLPEEWFFRQLFILGGVAFLFALFQFNPNVKALDGGLVIIVVATFLHAVIGILQLHYPVVLQNRLPLASMPIPIGVFQQVNNHASFLATGIVVTLYTLTRPSFRKGWLSGLLVLFTLPAAFYVILQSGSRTGLLGLVLAIPILFICRRRQFFERKWIVLVAVLLSLSTVFVGRYGLDQASAKVATAATNPASSARVTIYSIGLELLAKEPLHGHGIGNFVRAWVPQAADYYRRNPGVYMPESISHPHNELLFWVIEGGAIAVVGLVLTIFGIMYGLYRCGFQRGGGYAAMLLPISLHTQVELPFYTSVLHWFLWLFLLFLPLRHQVRAVCLRVSGSFQRLMQIVIVLFVFFSSLFLVDVLDAQADLNSSLNDRDKPPPHLQVALRNPYFKPDAELVAMRTNLYSGIESNETERVVEYVKWADGYIKDKPVLMLYIDLIKAERFLRPETYGCGAVKRALRMYPHVANLQERGLECRSQSMPNLLKR
ncbi:MAG: Wzy polymerase domain-containing protein [Sedimenticola sp.]|nr:Wzy polymerase domain-containing protein [Sedimenticola sp.]